MRGKHEIYFHEYNYTTYILVHCNTCDLSKNFCSISVLSERERERERMRMKGGDKEFVLSCAWRESEFGCSAITGAGAVATGVCPLPKMMMSEKVTR